jgi:hypothetical protein
MLHIMPPYNTHVEDSINNDNEWQYNFMRVPSLFMGWKKGISWSLSPLTGCSKKGLY